MVVTFLGLLFLRVATEFYKQQYRAWEARKEFKLLKAWILQQHDDCLMSDGKWEKLLPMCRYADKRYGYFSGVIRFSRERSCEDLVLEILGEAEEASVE